MIRGGTRGVSVNWQTTGLQNPDWGFESLHPCSRSRNNKRQWLICKRLAWRHSTGVAARFAAGVMGKQKVLTASSVVGEMFQVGLYKPTQGRVTRQVTCGTLWVSFALGAYRAYQLLYTYELWQYVVPMAILALGFWASYRLVNYPRFADFLIAVEAEMNKVSWPSRAELIRSSIVVIFVIFALAIVLFGYDVVWKFLFREVLGILR